MKINNIAYHKQKLISPNFTSTNISKYDTSLSDFHGNEISKIAKIIGEKFSNSKSTKIYDLGCSDGTFSYALAINLMEILQQTAKKFFPITAVDKDKTIIEYAKKRFINFKPVDQACIKTCSTGQGKSLEKYFEYINTNLSTYNIKKEVQENKLSYDK